MRRLSFLAILLCCASFAHAGTYNDNLFVRALANDSTAPDYVLITVVDPNTDMKRTVCTTANLFLGAIHREYGLGYTEAEVKRAKSIALKQRDRTFRFTRKAALSNLADHATPKALTDVRGQMAAKIDSQLLDRRFIESLVPMRPETAHLAYRDAVARSLLERGIGCAMGDPADFLIPHK